MYCTSCEKENLQGASFCASCGSPLSYAANAAADNMQAAQKPKKKNALVITISALIVVLAATLTLFLLGVFNGANKTASASPQKSVIESQNPADSSGDITKSTIIREPLPKGSVNETGYYTDETGLLKDESELLSGLEYFYYKTGVQPYVYLTGSINGSGDTPSMDELKAFAESKYDERFTDGAHLLLVLLQNDTYYRYWYTVGPQANSVIDKEAGDILGNYVDKYYFDTNLSYEQYFSKVFKMTADRIMSVTTRADLIVPDFTER